MFIFSCLCDPCSAVAELTQQLEVVEASMKTKEEAHGEVTGELAAAEIREKELQQQLQVRSPSKVFGKGAL